MRYSSFILEENHVFIEEENPLQFNIAEGEQDGIDIDGIGNLMDLSKLMFIDEKVRILKSLMVDSLLEIVT